ncbi:CmpA/NrtA family ABC transporter substrate-binding protein [Asticcacaulis sp. AND118]|uniref:CmpA/NrtA family ABC transporter substrate-binding protein n=1 Tax=Asticcacaulis sp. AND118 TaxID=2840468 RepID=UPI001D0010ED|nr:CmpA/NrtA family ABC transporter substrate-binding protein [Asticcacaulis sp. AND118]UDF04010.1 ABC transporter substrate-binding protein [Asticcacaulis sp. AND118]
MLSVRIGFSPLNDAALVVLAEVLGCYAAEGLDVSLSREANWSNIRDKLSYGLLDAAHVLATLPLARGLGLGPTIGQIIAPMALGANGNSVVISSKLKEVFEGMGASTLLESARALRLVIQHRRAVSEGKVTLAIPFNYSPHHFVLRHWLAAGGVDPDRQVQWVVLPPSRMADHLRDGVIDGFCSGSPWPQMAELNGDGVVLFSDPAFWTLKPEKVLALRGTWADEHPEEAVALTRAVLRAGQWAADPANANAMAEVLSQKIYVGAPLEAVQKALAPGGAGLILDPQTTTFPWISHAKWFIGQFVRWGLTEGDHDFDAIARRVYRPDLWRQAAEPLGLSLPLDDEKDEGGAAEAWTLPAEPNDILMPPNTLFDGGVFRVSRA